jgi:FtsP/CotA-like multicopper oxidase with cupredoxin domain
MTGLPEARVSQVIALADGDEFDIRIAPVVKQLGEAHVRMLSYNGSIPGPTLQVRQGSSVTVHVLNEGDIEATVHWHGLRLDNRYDGTARTQEPIPIGGRFSYRLTFPDAGAYWYHPHIREDYTQELGLYGSIVVEPSDRDYWPRVHQALAVTLDDILLEDGKIATFERSGPTFTAMGRFGNAFLVNGSSRFALQVRRGEVVRFYLTDTANTRVFNVRFRGASMKLVGGDSGHFEREELVEQLVIAPSERVVVDVLFDQEGPVAFEHRTPDGTYDLGVINVSDESAQPPLAEEFTRLRTNSDMLTERGSIAKHLHAEPDKTLALVAEMDMGSPELPAGATLTYFCPMHAEVTSERPGRCPKCQMKLLPRAAGSAGYTCPMHPDVKSDQPDRCPKCGMKLVPAQVVAQSTVDQPGHVHKGPTAHAHQRPDAAADDMYQAPAGIEWEDDMFEVNRMTTRANMRWKLVDRVTGAEGAAIDWKFRVGDRVKIRVINEMDSDHPMHHPFHIHGAGRFLILARNGVVESNLVWKDTVLIPTGQVVDLLLDVSNPGVWMAHCHIAEHHESGMMLSFVVDP